MAEIDILCQLAKKSSGAVDRFDAEYEVLERELRGKGLID